MTRSARLGSINEGSNSHHEQLSHPTDNAGGTDEEDVQDDMSDYYKVRPRKSMKRVPNEQKSSLISTSSSSSALPIHHPIHQLSDSRNSHHRLSQSSSAPDGSLRLGSRPQSAPDDRYKFPGGELSQGQSSKYTSTRPPPTQILLPGGTYVDTGGSRGVVPKPRSSTNSNSRNLSNSSPKRAPVNGGGGGVTYNLNGKKEKNRSSSTSRLRSGQQQTMTTSRGSMRHDPNRSLNRMYEDEMIDELDAVMKFPKQGTNSKQQHAGYGRGEMTSSEGYAAPSFLPFPCLFSTLSLRPHGGNRSSSEWTPNQDPRRMSSQLLHHRSEKMKVKESDSPATTIWL
jgi:hypothetical protein